MTATELSMLLSGFAAGVAITTIALSYFIFKSR
jgi:hypothetical protein